MEENSLRIKFPDFQLIPNLTMFNILLVEMISVKKYLQQNLIFSQILVYIKFWFLFNLTNPTTIFLGKVNNEGCELTNCFACQPILVCFYFMFLVKIPLRHKFLVFPLHQLYLHLSCFQTHIILMVWQLLFKSVLVNILPTKHKALSWLLADPGRPQVLWVVPFPGRWCWEA